MSKIIYSTSAKGGVGTTLFTTNFAYFLSKQLKDKRVLFLDFNCFSDTNYFFGLRNNKNLFTLKTLLTKNIKDKALEKAFDKVVNQYEELDIVFAPADFTEYSLAEKHFSKILEKATELYDYIIIDGGTVGAYVNIDFLKHVDQILLVSTLDIMSIQKNRYLIKYLKENKINNLKIILNQVNSFSVKKISKVFSCPTIGVLPTEAKHAWANVCLGELIAEKKSKFLKALNKIFKELNLE